MENNINLEKFKKYFNKDNNFAMALVKQNSENLKKFYNKPLHEKDVMILNKYLLNTNSINTNFLKTILELCKKHDDIILSNKTTSDEDAFHKKIKTPLYLYPIINPSLNFHMETFFDELSDIKFKTTIKNEDYDFSFHEKSLNFRIHPEIKEFYLSHFDPKFKKLYFAHILEHIIETNYKSKFKSQFIEVLNKASVEEKKWLTSEMARRIKAQYGHKSLDCSILNFNLIMHKIISPSLKSCQLSRKLSDLAKIKIIEESLKTNLEKQILQTIVSSQPSIKRSIL